MKHLGIDYGTKKIGIAISDRGGSLAFPKMIIPSNKQSIETIINYIQTEEIQKVVVGYSRAYDGSDNLLQKDIDLFVGVLSKRIPETPIVFQDERGSSIAARSHLYSKGNIANERWSSKDNEKKRSAIDAQAAAVILQRYFDTSIL